MRDEIRKIWKNIRNENPDAQTSFLIDAFKLYDNDPLRLSGFYAACFMVSLGLMLSGWVFASLLFLVVPAEVYYYHWFKYLQAQKRFIKKWLR